MMVVFQIFAGRNPTETDKMAAMETMALIHSFAAWLIPVVHINNEVF